MILEFSIMLIMMIFATINDLKNKNIKNIIPMCGILVGLILSFFNKNNILYDFIASFVYFFLLFYIPRSLNVKEFLGAGDIKLYIAITFLMGTKYSIYTFIYSIFIGCFCLLVINLKRIKEIIQNVSIFFLVDKQTTSKIIDKGNPNIFAIYILISSIIVYIQLFIFNNDWIFKNIF